MDDITARAFSAYFREGKRTGTTPEQPTGGGDRVTVGGHEYVLLSNINGLLAAFRISNQGKLKRLRVWPEGIGYDAGGNPIARELRRTA